MDIETIKKEIELLQQDLEDLSYYWFFLGEQDKQYGLPIQYSDNEYYVMGWYDKEYQLEIGYNCSLEEVF